MIENADGTPEELEKRKRDVIRYRNLKRNSNIFVICSSIIQIVESLIILAVLLVVSLFVMFKIFHIDENPAAAFIMQATFLILFFAGIILGFIAYRKTMHFIMTKFDFSDKLLQSTIEHFVVEKKK